MSDALRTLLDLARRLTAAGRHTPFPSRLGDHLADRVGTAVGEVARAALGGAVAAATGVPVPRGLIDPDPQPRAGDYRCPTWRQVGDALAAAAVAAGSVPGGRGMAVALGALAAVADLVARASSDAPAN